MPALASGDAAGASKLLTPRGLLRLRLRVLMSAQDSRAAVYLERKLRLGASLQVVFEDCLHEIRHPRPRYALGFALGAVDSVLASAFMLSGPAMESFVRSEDEELAAELTRLFLSCLGCAGLSGGS